MGSYYAIYHPLNEEMIEINIPTMAIAEKKANEFCKVQPGTYLEIIKIEKGILSQTSAVSVEVVN